MKRLILIILVTFKLSAQEVEVRGFAVDTTKGRNNVQIVKNDTLSKISIEDDELFNRVWKNPNCVTTTSENGKFSIRAKLSDSLHFTSYRHFKQVYKVADLVKMKTILIKLEPEVCTEYVPCNDGPSELYVFVAKKIQVEYADDIYYCNLITMDSKFKAKYEVIENVFGSYSEKIIEFESYDHGSIIRYDVYDYVLLYVAKYCGKLIHVKYQYSPLYKTENGKWVSPPVKNYNPKVPIGTLKPHKVDVKEPIKLRWEMSEEKLKAKYTSPNFRIENGKVYFNYGYYPIELFEMNKSTLKQFGFFN